MSTLVALMKDENSPVERTRWIRSRRPDLNSTRDSLSVDLPGGWFIEKEPNGHGDDVLSLTIFLTNRECPWTCLMCDLWKYTTRIPVPIGTIPRQIDHAMDAAIGGCPRPSQIKLYNAGSFFDVGAIPRGDYTRIAYQASSFQRVVVECHPLLVGPRVVEFKAMLPPETRLEIAMGLETVHLDALDRLNKRVTLEQFQKASKFLVTEGIDLRVFILIQPPFVPEAEAVEWAVRSAEFAWDCGARFVSMIPTRMGNGALEMLQQSGQFSRPKAETVDRAFCESLRKKRGILQLDLWELSDSIVPDGKTEFWRQRWESMNRFLTS